MNLRNSADGSWLSVAMNATELGTSSVTGRMITPGWLYKVICVSNANTNAVASRN